MSETLFLEFPEKVAGSASEEEKREAQGEDIPPGPPYYALKVRLSTVAIWHIRGHTGIERRCTLHRGTGG